MEIAIPFIKLATEEKEGELAPIFDEIRSLFKSSQFILGDKVADFENRYAEVAGCRYGVGLNSGLDALLLGLRSLGVGPGDEVITAPNSFVASAAAISLIGAKPVFVDVAEDYNLNPELLEDAISDRTKAIMPVHLTGNPCRMKEINAIAARHGLKVIEDAAQAIGASIDGRPVGSWGDIGAFSLHPLKNLHVWGDGGIATTNSDAIAKELRLQRNHGLKNRDEVQFFSFNSRLDTIQAIVGANYLKLLPATTERRIKNARLYDGRLRRLSGFVTPPPSPLPGVKHVYHVYQTRVQRRTELVEHLLKRGIETKVHYPIPIHWQKASESLGYKVGDFPMTDRLAEEILSLPIRESLTENDISEVCDAIESFYA